MDKITIDELSKAYTKLGNAQTDYNNNALYTKGYNPKILRELQRKPPDNRIPVPMAKAAIDDMVGYAGRNIQVTYENKSQLEDEEVKEDEYNDLLQQIQDFNDDDLLLSEVYRECLSQKEAYLLFWATDEMKLPKGMMTPEYQLVTMKELVVFYDKSLKPKITHAVRFMHDEDTDQKIAIVYYPGFAEGYVGNGYTWKRNSDYDLKYPYEKVPVIVFKMSKDGGPLFDAEKPLIDAHDSALSKAQNEIDRFNALVTLFPGKVTPEFVQKLEEMKALQELDQYDADKWPHYLEKNLTGVVDYSNQLMDRLERLFHKTIKIPDMTTQDFSSGDEAGVARAFKLLGMEFKASEIEIYFIKGIYERTSLFNDCIKASTLSINPEEYDTKVEMKRNLPIDDEAKARIVQILAGLLTDETLLSYLPKTIVEDPKREAEKRSKEKEQDLERFMNDGLGDNDQDPENNT